MASNRVSDTGITIVYEPRASQPIVDIVFVHGLQGHPFKTWASKKTAKGSDELPSARPQSSQTSSKSEKERKSVLPRLVSRLKMSGSRDAKLSGGEPGADTSHVFWPRDLLPAQCSQARILVFGYDTMVAKHLAGATNKNSIFSHSKDLLYELSRSRPLKRRLIFVAHSLGGIVVKEMLANCSTSSNSEFEDIMESTAAVIFLGTPHRGSTAAGIGEVARRVASALLIVTNSALLDSLSLKNSDLERSQDAFTSLWRKYDFRVKTFQEGLPFGTLNIAPLNQKVVPDTSSCLGDPRERAETLQANHMEMCRFSETSESNYRKVAGELSEVYLSLMSLVGHNENLDKSQRFNGRELNENEKACLNSLRFPGMLNRQQAIDNPVDSTCQWLMQTPIFTNWISRRNTKEHFGLFQIIGKPGSGKSTLMKKTFDQIYSQLSGPNVCVAGFFFHGRGSRLQHSVSGLFRSLLYQTLPFYNDPFQYCIFLYSDKEKDDNRNVEWHQSELKSIFHSIFSKPGLFGRTIIFIDGIDECDNADIREIAYYFREITRSAYNAGVELDVCISRRHYPPISLTYCPEIQMENFNGPDIRHYIRLRFEMADLSTDNQWAALETQVLQRSDGVFLWAVLVVDMLLKERDLGRNIKYLDRRTKELPGALEQLFVELLKDIDLTEVRTTLRLFQWVLLATGPLRLREWHHILAFIREPPPSSLREWRESEHYTETDDQLEKQIRSISRGLVEVKTQLEFELEMEDRESMYAGAGSLDSAYGDSRLIQPIHESVREFFLHGKGFSLFDQSLCNNFVGYGHLALLSCCVDYLNIKELDAFINARLNSGRSLPELRPLFRRHTAASFGSSASSHSTRGFVEFSESTPGLHRDRFSETASLGLGRLRDWLRDGNNESMKHNADSEDAGDKLPALPFLPAPGRFCDMFAAVTPLGIGQVDESPRDGSNERMKHNVDNSADASMTGKSQTLEDYPALQSYAVNRAFIHAKIAEREGADPSRIVRKLLNTGAWTRWASLQENITKETSLLGFVAEQGLATWIGDLAKLKDDCDSFKDELEDTLISATKRGDHKVMRCLIQAGACFPRDSRRAILRKSPLHHIILSSNLELLKFFWASIEACFASIGRKKMREILNWQDEMQYSPLHLAIKNGDLPVVEELVKYGADVNLRAICGETPLHLSADSKNTCGGDKATKLDIDVNSKASSTLMSVPQTSETHLFLVKLLLNHGAVVNVDDDIQRTPLHSAAKRNCNCGIVEELLRYGADKNARDCGKETPLHLAARFGHQTAVGALLDYSADINAKNESGETPLHLAASSGQCNIVDELLKHGADFDSVDKWGRTPLWSAVSGKDSRVVFTLLRHGANTQRRNALTDAVTYNDYDAAAAILDHDRVDSHNLLLAIQRPNYQLVVEKLIDCGANINVRDADGDTPLHYACTRHRNIDAKFCKLLLEKGADPSIKNRNGNTPYDRAVAGGLQDQIALLKQYMGRETEELISGLGTREQTDL